MSKILTTITELPVADIQLDGRLRPVSPNGVEALKASFAELGVMKDPIHVRKIKKTGRVVLMAGGHRLTAARELGWDTIAVTCWECTDDFARLMEIDDNLAGSELTPLDTAVFLAARKDVYERMHPESKKGGARGNQHTGGWHNDTMSFCQSAAEKLGCSKRTVERLVKAGAALRDEETNALRGAPQPVSLKDLAEIAKIGEPDERYRVVSLLSFGKAKNAAHARRTYQAEQGRGPTPLNPTDQAYVRLQDAWKRAPKAARRQFLDECGAELRDLLDGHGGDAA